MDKGKEAKKSRKRKPRVDNSDGDEAPPSWVLKKGEPLPVMSAKKNKVYHLPTRSIKEDEADLVLPDRSKGEVPCAYGSACTSVEDISGGPMVPIKAMGNSKACILCHRKNMRSKYVRYTILEHTIPRNRLVQKWESPIGSGGYRAEACIGRHPKHYNGFVSQVAIGNASDYTWTCDPETGKWRIDQSMLYQDFHAASPTPQHLSRSPRGGASNVSFGEKNKNTDT